MHFDQGSVQENRERQEVHRSVRHFWTPWDIFCRYLLSSAIARLRSTCRTPRKEGEFAERLLWSSQTSSHGQSSLKKIFSFLCNWLLSISRRTKDGRTPQQRSNRLNHSPNTKNHLPPIHPKRKRLTNNNNNRNLRWWSLDAQWLEAQGQRPLPHLPLPLLLLQIFLHLPIRPLLQLLLLLLLLPQQHITQN